MMFCCWVHEVSVIAAFCDSRKSLDQMCGEITGDASLFSMFRAEPADGPVPCPFKGAPFTFTYNRGSGDCGSPVSRVDSCTDESQLLLRYQACPDVHGTESTGLSPLRNWFFLLIDWNLEGTTEECQLPYKRKKMWRSFIGLIPCVGEVVKECSSPNNWLVSECSDNII